MPVTQRNVTSGEWINDALVTPTGGTQKTLAQALKDAADAGPAAPTQVSAPEKTAGTETALRSFSPKDVAEMAYTHGPSGGGSYTDEQAQDAVGSILTDSSSIDFTYNDAANTITATAIFGTSAGTVCQGNDSRLSDARTPTTHTHSNLSVSTQYSLTGGGDLSTSRTLSLVNDVASPGNSKYYGTNSGGTRGYYDLPSGGGGGGMTVTSVKTANYTAANREIVPTNTTSGAFTVTFPATPSPGWEVDILDIAGTWTANNLTLAGNGANIESAAGTFTLDTNARFMRFIYIDATRGWVSAHTVNVPLRPVVNRLNVSGNIVNNAINQFYGSTTGQTLTLPSMANGDILTVDNVSSVSVTIARNGQTINGAASNDTLTTGKSVQYYWSESGALRRIGSL